jgi:hypothetical protein
MGDLLKFERPLPDGGDPRRPCGRCGKPMSRDAIRCRRCGARFDEGLASSRPLIPLWLWVGVILAITILLGGLLFGR